MDRRAARTQAVQALYLQRSGTLPREDALESFLGVGDPMDEWARQLFHGVNDALHEIDQQIQDASKSWRLERIAWVDLSILRLGAFELRQGTEPAIVINEAVEIARLLGDEKTPAFVNGLLDAIAKNMPWRTNPT